MKTMLKVTGYSLIVSSFLCSLAIAQDSLNAKRNAMTEHSTSIITTVPFNGIKYFIKIVPIDTSLSDNMPICNPDAGRVLSWKRPLRQLLPDTVLQYLPKREDLFRLSPPMKKSPIFPKLK